jgi:4-hydroxy-tetrahydrodipicolinate reductase
MKIAISGYGKMGKAIEEIALLRGHEISARITSGSKGNDDLNNLNKNSTDLVIEFSTPETVMQNIRTCFEKNIPVVVGTTGWYKHLPELQKEVMEKKYSFLYASNFSIGVNLFFELNKFLAKMMQPYADYKAELSETHHVHKLDAPSGTAISLAEDLIKSNSRYSKWKTEDSDQSNELPVRSHRLDEVPGTHIVKYESEIDLIEIKHEAKSRKGFAYGAVLAAEWMQGKSGFFNMSDVLNVNLR